MMNPVILHVEDNADIADVVALAFEHLGLHVEILNASTLGTALQQIKQRRQSKQRLDLVIVDINLPDGSGLDLIRIVKTNPAWSSLPMIVLSAQTGENTVSEAYALGANCYFPKLINDKSLFDVVEHLYSCWFEIGRSPNVPSSFASEILGRAISVKAQVSDIYMKLARSLSDHDYESGLLLRLAINESNHANLFAFFNLDNQSIPTPVLNKLSQYVEAKEKNLLSVRHGLGRVVNPQVRDAARWALQLEESFDPETVSLAAGCLFPNGPAATIALYQGTLNHMNVILDLAATQKTDAEIMELSNSLRARIQAAQHAAPQQIYSCNGSGTHQSATPFRS